MSAALSRWAVLFLVLFTLGFFLSYVIAGDQSTTHSAYEPMRFFRMVAPPKQPPNVFIEIIGQGDAKGLTYAYNWDHHYRQPPAYDLVAWPKPLRLESLPGRVVIRFGTPVPPATSLLQVFRGVSKRGYPSPEIPAYYCNTTLGNTTTECSITTSRNGVTLFTFELKPILKLGLSKYYVSLWSQWPIPTKNGKPHFDKVEWLFALVN